MSQQGLTQTHQLLQVINSQLPSIAQASETVGIDLTQFIFGALAHSGLQPTSAHFQFVGALVQLIGPPTEAPSAQDVLPG